MLDRCTIDARRPAPWPEHGRPALVSPMPTRGQLRQAALHLVEGLYVPDRYLPWLGLYVLQTMERPRVRRRLRRRP